MQMDSTAFGNVHSVDYRERAKIIGGSRNVTVKYSPIEHEMAMLDDSLLREHSPKMSVQELQVAA